VKVELSAEAQVDEIDAWWRENRQAAPNLFAEELEALLRALAEACVTHRRRASVACSSDAHTTICTWWRRRRGCTSPPSGAPTAARGCRRTPQQHAGSCYAPGVQVTEAPLHPPSWLPASRRSSPLVDARPRKLASGGSTLPARRAPGTRRSQAPNRAGLPPSPATKPRRTDRR